MEYISAREAAEKWGVSLRLVQRLLQYNRIEGARKFGRSWLIPANAKKPSDPRKKQPTDVRQPAYLPYLLLTTEFPIASGKANEQWDEALTAQFEYELEYLRGNFEKSKECFYKTPADARTKLCACTLSMISSISTNDYASFNEINLFLKQTLKTTDDELTRNTIKNIYDLIYSSLFALNSVSQELKSGDLSSYCNEAKSTSVYLYAKYLLVNREKDALIACAETALSLINHKEDEYTSVDIYLHIMCAAAYALRDNRDKAKKHIKEALQIAVPRGYYSPIAENISVCNGLVEQCMAEMYPKHLKRTTDQWNNNSLNWVRFHNSFTKDNITCILSLREQHLASLLLSGKTYGEAAKAMELSRGRINVMISEIYEKLYISKKADLMKYISTVK